MAQWALLFIIFSIIYFDLSFAQPCYVSTNGTNSDSCGSSNKPCATILKCLEEHNYAANLNVWLTPGTYVGDGFCNITTPYLNLSAFDNENGLSDVVTIDCEGKYPHFRVSKNNNPGLASKISGITFTNGKSKVIGGCVSWDSSSGQIDGCTFRNCTSGAGGALFVDEGVKLVISNSTFISNRATIGGAVFSKGQVDYQHCNFVNNGAGSAGAVFHSGGGIYHCEFKENVGSTMAGAIMANVSNIALTGSITESNITHNSAGFAAGVYIQQSVTPFLISNTRFVSNKALGTGGGLHLGYNSEPIVVSLTDSYFFGNVGQDGSAISVFTEGVQSLRYWNWKNNTIESNIDSDVDRGGPVYISVSPKFKSFNFALNGLLLQNNHPEGIICNGGDLPFCDSKCTTTNCTYCIGACVITKQATHICHISNPPECDHGNCSMNALEQAKCDCAAGYQGDLCDKKISHTKDSITNHWEFWLGIGGGIIVFIILFFIIANKCSKPKQGYETIQ